MTAKLAIPSYAPQPPRKHLEAEIRVPRQGKRRSSASCRKMHATPHGESPVSRLSVLRILRFLDAAASQAWTNRLSPRHPLPPYPASLAFTQIFPRSRITFRFVFPRCYRRGGGDSLSALDRAASRGWPWGASEDLDYPPAGIADPF